MPAVPTVLLTGASGVLGTALLPELSDRHVTALVHRTPVPGADEQLTGDLTRPRLGLDRRAYADLCARVDAVVHCAAVTGFGEGPEATHALNEAGTRRIVRLVADADALLYHVSSAFVARTGITRSGPGQNAGGRTARPEDYLDSKRAGEDVVRTSGVPAVIIRPSVIIGDSRTGEISAFQGLHAMLKGLLRGRLPLVPLSPDSLIDFVPQDVVAATVAALVRDGAHDGPVWVTAGDQALRAGRILELAADFAADTGLDPTLPRMVPPELVDRLIRPVFMADLPIATRRRLDDLLAMTALFTAAEPFPTDLGRAPGLPPAFGADRAERSLRATLSQLVRAKGINRPAPALVTA
ncbi:SDR family oxidoreductase [Streptomyces sp. NPDC057445]|uniref:SDR family oxidoreductase n=1 Tax=Streptomyces sp. NPDC057445 TaxID=3346136 RepID=UPI0036CEB673